MDEASTSLRVFSIRFAFVFFLIVLIASACRRDEKVPPPSASGPPDGPSTGSRPAAAAPVANPPRWIVTNYETETNVKTLAIDGDDLWLGLPNGIIRYNTRTDQHETFTTKNTGGRLLSKGIYKIKIDAQGNKWIGLYGGGLTKYDGRAWTTYTPKDGLGDLWVYDMAFDAQGRMWIATWNGVSVYDGKRFKTYRVKDGLADKWVYSIGLDHDGIFWFGTEDGVSRFDGKTWKNYNHADGLGMDVGPPPVMPPAVERMKDPTGTKGGGDYGAGAQGHHSGNRQNIGPNPNFIIAVAVDHENNKWFGTWGAGLSKFDGKTWTNYTMKDGLGGNFIHAITVDRDGSIWVGTNGGVSRLDGQGWTTFSTKDGLINDNIFSIVMDEKGNKWFGTWRGLTRFSPS